VKVNENAEKPLHLWSPRPVVNLSRALFELEGGWPVPHGFYAGGDLQSRNLTRYKYFGKLLILIPGMSVVVKIPILITLNLCISFTSINTTRIYHEQTT
jgi:hypothetical protein